MVPYEGSEVQMSKKKPIRSMLYVPGNKEKWLRTAPKHGSDAVILDLEDSVPTSEKNEARKLIQNALATLGACGHTVFVRTNSLETGLIEEDLKAVVHKGLYGILLPKAYRASDIFEVDKLLRKFEQQSKLQVGTILISPLIETAKAIHNTYKIGMASSRISYMSIGHAMSGDISRELGFTWTREGKETLYIRSKVLLDARAAGDRYPCAGPWSAIHDLDGFRSYCWEMKQLGYTGATVLHPSHVLIANDVFTPTADEVGYYKGLVRTIEEAEKSGFGAVLYEGQMIDLAMKKTALEILDLARQFGVLETEFFA
jgi:citrate lyase subunit beta/citryl-CoA lyase